MVSKRKDRIYQDLSLNLKKFIRLRWEQTSRNKLKSSECELLGILSLGLEEKKEPLTASELSDLLKITPAGVTHLVNPLEKFGYVKRLKDPNDRRIVLVDLTAKGTALAEMLITETNERLTGLINFLGEKDSRTLIRLISSTVDYFESNPSGK